MKYLTIEDSIGKTPLVRLQRLGEPENGARGNVILGKLEGNNPAGSVKDRPSLAMIQGAQDRGEVKPGDTVQEEDTLIILESMKIASLADTYEINIAPHNFNGHIGSLMSAHLCAAIPNFRVMEIDIDSAPWRDELVTVAPTFENGAEGDFLVQDAGFGQGRRG
mgnify:CR=1 FL=1